MALRPCEADRGGVRIFNSVHDTCAKTSQERQSRDWLMLTARVRGNRNPRTGFGSFARAQKNNFAKVNFMQKSNLETYG